MLTSFAPTAIRGSGFRGCSRPMGSVPTSKSSNISPHMLHVVLEGPAVLPCGSSSDSGAMLVAGIALHSSKGEGA